eukprot:2899870-Amphidinium_carterae.1
MLQRSNLRSFFEANAAATWKAQAANIKLICSPADRTEEYWKQKGWDDGFELQIVRGTEIILEYFFSATLCKDLRNCCGLELLPQQLPDTETVFRLLTSHCIRKHRNTTTNCTTRRFTH